MLSIDIIDLSITVTSINVHSVSELSPSVTLSGNKLNSAKMILKWKACPFTGFEFVTLNCLLFSGFFNFINQEEPNRLISLPWHFHCLYSFITLLFFLKKTMFNSLFSEISLLVPSLFSLPFSRLCVCRTLLETSDQECTLELAENLLCYHQNDVNYLCWNNLWWKIYLFFNLEQQKI